MSVAVCFLARTGIVIGTDSRVTARPHSDGVTREDAYPKLVPFGDHPIALAMVGAGSYGGRDFHSLVTEALGRFGADARPSVAEVAAAFSEVATPVAQSSARTDEMSVWIGGFSPGEPFAELHGVTLPSGAVEVLRSPGEHTIRWQGSDEAISTLWWGARQSTLVPLMVDAGLDQDAARAVIEKHRTAHAWGPDRLNWGMPLPSAVDLVKFLLTVQVTYERFMPGRARSGLPLQVIAIRATGYTWIDNPFPW